MTAVLIPGNLTELLTLHQCAFTSHYIFRTVLDLNQRLNISTFLVNFPSSSALVKCKQTDVKSFG